MGQFPGPSRGQYASGYRAQVQMLAYVYDSFSEGRGARAGGGKGGDEGVVDEEGGGLDRYR